MLHTRFEARSLTRRRTGVNSSRLVRTGPNSAASELKVMKKHMNGRKSQRRPPSQPGVRDQPTRRDRPFFCGSAAGHAFADIPMTNSTDKGKLCEKLGAELAID